MKSGVKKANMALMAVAATMVLLSMAVSLHAKSRLGKLIAHNKSLSLLDGDLRMLDAYSRAEALLAESGPLPREVPLPVSIPAPADSSADAKTSQTGWRTAEFSLRWEAPARTVLDALAALCNLGPSWSVASFSLHPLGDGAVLEATVSTARPDDAGAAQEAD